MKISSRVAVLGGGGEGVGIVLDGEDVEVILVGVEEGGGRRRRRSPERREPPDNRFQRWRSVTVRLFSRAILAKLSPFLIRTHTVGGVGLVWTLGEEEVGVEMAGGGGEEGRRRTSPGRRSRGLMVGLALVRASTEVDWLFAI